MSQILCADYLSPPKENPAIDFLTSIYGDTLRVPMTKAVPLVEREAALPDPRVFRSMSRAAVLLSVVGLRAKALMEAQLKEDAFAVGIYCAVENGPVDFESAKNIFTAGVTQENFAELYKKYRNPKMYLKQLPNLAAAQMGIFIGALGPMHVYNHSRFGSLSALEQAEADLAAGRVKLALRLVLKIQSSWRGPAGRLLREGFLPRERERSCSAQANPKQTGKTRTTAPWMNTLESVSKLSN